MVIPNSKQLQRSNGDNPPTIHPPKLSYANAARRSTVRHSLLHDGGIPPPSQTANQGVPQVLQSAFTEAPAQRELFCLTSPLVHSQYTEQQVYVLLKEQHPNCHSCAPMKMDLVNI
ncbi:unnamed protein product [Mucor hiemalis]